MEEEGNFSDTIQNQSYLEQMYSGLVTTEEEAPLDDQMSLYKEKDEKVDVIHCQKANQKLTSNSQTSDKLQYQVYIKQCESTISYYNRRTKNQWKGILYDPHFLCRSFPISLLVIFVESTKIINYKSIIKIFEIQDPLLIFTTVLKTKKKRKDQKNLKLNKRTIAILFKMLQKQLEYHIKE